jgi:spermidine dehydrogenase
MTKKRDKDLGMDRAIDRRDFLQGVAIGALASGLAPELAEAARAEQSPQDAPGYYPPTRLGMRGSHPGSFEMAHALRDGDFWNRAERLDDTGESYDLVVVGGGISGLSAAHFFREARGQGARILILDNHDDFGGHAKRNEFHLAGQLALKNGGTLEIDSPRPYSPAADGVLKTLGIDPDALSKACSDNSFYKKAGLKRGTFFDKETFGTDRLVIGGDRKEGAAAMGRFLAGAPLSDAVRRDIFRIEFGRDDYLPGLTSAQKKDRLSRISYRDYLLNVVKADAGVGPYYQHLTDDWWGSGIDAISAIDCWGMGYPGFQGLKLAPGSMPRMGFTPAGYVDTGGSYSFHFPDGNASIARLLVRRLIPEAIPGHDARDIVTQRCDYAKLDRAGAAVRLRLNSIVVRVRNAGPGVEIAYASAGRVFRVRAKNCVLASWNMMIPYLCPELPETQKAALHRLVKSPLVYTNVALRNWTSFHKLGIYAVNAPGSYHSNFELNEVVDIGAYKSPRTPEAPMLIRMMRAPALPGLNEPEQNKAGRAELLATSFETFERNIRDQLGRTLGHGGFDPARDIEGIAVNRWPHGYAPEYNALVDGDTPPDKMPYIVARARFGRIAIANSDCGNGAYTDVAIDQAHRAVHELLGA